MAKTKPKPVPREAARFRVQDQRDAILDSINEGVFTVDCDWRITSFNRAAESITGVPRAEAIGQRCSEVFRANICEASCALRQTLSTGEPTVNATVYVVNDVGERIPIKVSAAVLHDSGGKVIGGVETFQDLRQVEALRKRLEERHGFADILGKSAPMRQLFEVLPQIAESEATVLIEGQSGTGKELFARAIHQLSRRREKRFLAINCGALPDTLLESELFGYKAGAFTDAKRDKPGRFAEARGGTLFLDEVGDVSPAMQVRLLRVLQERTYEPLGSSEPVRADVRIVAATNKDLRKLVAEGSFREDLYYRIHVVNMRIPSLAERREDIPLLVDHFIAASNRLHDKGIVGMSPEALALCMKHSFPGNVRELENAIEHAFVLCGQGVIEPEHLPEDLREPGHGAISGTGTLRSIETARIREVLHRNEGNRARTAAELGIDPSTLYRKIKQLGIQVPAGDGRRRGGS